MNLEEAIANTRAHLLSLRHAAGHWEGELSSSALSTATAVVALSTVDPAEYRGRIARGTRWLIANQNADGGWGDTTISKSNLSTTLLCWSALTLESNLAGMPEDAERAGQACVGCEAWVRQHVGSPEPDAICRAVVARYGRDRTFSVPILMTCAIGGRLGPHDEAWRRVLALPFELAALPRSWFGAVGLPVVSYAMPALIAIGHARFHHAPPAQWNPLRWLRRLLWPRISPMLRTLQPGSGGYLEATPLTSFVTMALASSGEKRHPCVPPAVEFLAGSQRADGSWAIDSNLATWVTTLSVKALFGNADTPVRDGIAGDADRSVRNTVKDWLLAQQYKTVHPFTNAAPGGWAWTDLPGGVPDADDTSGALIALWHLCDSAEERRQILPAVDAGVQWLLGLQNRDGGMPTFCRGWGALPFDRSTPEITAHAIAALARWRERLGQALRGRADAARIRALDCLERQQRGDGSWQPLWFGNESAPGEANPVHGTAMVLLGLAQSRPLDNRTGEVVRRAVKFLLRSQHRDGGWGGAAEVTATIEETAAAVNALASWMGPDGIAPDQLDKAQEAVSRGAAWLMEHTQNGTEFSAAPIGLYFARLWYHERMYPVIWTLAALEHTAGALKSPMPELP